MKLLFSLQLFIAATLTGNTYVVPTIEWIEERADLIVIGSIEDITKTIERKPGTYELEEKEITILVILSLKGTSNEKRIKVRHTYEDSGCIAERSKFIESETALLEATGDKFQSLIKNGISGEQLLQSEEGKSFEQRIARLEEELDRFNKYISNHHGVSSDALEEWLPSKDEQFLVFLKEEGEKYILPNGMYSIRKLVMLNELPKRQTDGITEPVDTDNPVSPPETSKNQLDD